MSRIHSHKLFKVSTFLLRVYVIFLLLGQKIAKFSVDCLLAPYSAIHKAAGFMVHGHSTGLPGIIPKNIKGNYHADCPPDPVLYGGRPYGSFVNSTVTLHNDT